ncbi:MAG: type II secretion system protein GspD [Thermodesulfobacteriota bacterium]|nr:MAG: type II secretion system protein GspD [Thermodesulfobacteriota bacterium]
MRPLIIYLLSLIFLFSCSAKEPLKIVKEQAVEETPSKKESQEILIEKEKVKEEKKHKLQYEKINLPKYERKTPPKPLPPPPKKLDLSALLQIKEPIIVNVESMPLSDFIIYVIGETLKVMFIMDEDVMKNKTPITLKMVTPMPPEKVLETTIGMIERYGIEVGQKDGALYFFKPKPKPPRKPVEIRIGEEVPESPAEIIQVIPLKYIRPTEIQTFIREFYRNINFRIYLRENALILQGPASSIKEVAKFVKLFDVPYMQNKKVILLKLTYWQTEDFIKQISTILEGLGFTVAKTPKAPGIYFIPIKYLNSILVVAPDEITLSQVIDWTKKLDTAESAGTEEKAFVYSPKFSKASDLLESLKKLFSPVETSKALQQKKQASGKSQIISISGLKISADDKRNLLLIMTTPAKYKTLLTYLEKLDVPPRQVLIEAMVAELTLLDELKYGFEWFIRNKMFEGNYTLETTFGVPTTPGLTYTFLSETERLKVIINALATKNLVNILSTPRLMVLDNEEAVIQVGTDVPVVTGQVTTAEAAGATTGVVQTIQYRSTGIILRVKPTINTKGLLTLNITQEVSEMGSNPPGVSSPTILVRKINTNVVALSGQSIVLGGLISETQSTSESKVPFIGDIPILGELFKSKSKEKRKTELIIILTPRIVSSLEEASKITEDLKKELKWFK